MSFLRNIFLLCMLVGGIIHAEGDQSVLSKLVPSSKGSFLDSFAEYPLWLSDQKKEPQLFLPIPFSGVMQDFAQTGMYDISVRAKGFRSSFSIPTCSRCVPIGMTASFGAEAYVNNGPFWVGVRDLGGGFARHKHFDHELPIANEWVSSGARGVTFERCYQDSFIAFMNSPAIVMGTTLGGYWGCADVAFGVRPFEVSVNGGYIPTMHTQVFVQSYAYSRPVTLDGIRARLFVGLRAGAFAEDNNFEWGVAARPGSQLAGLVGVQLAYSWLRWGVSYGHVFQKAATYRIDRSAVFNHRSEEYRAMVVASEQARENVRHDRQTSVWNHDNNKRNDAAEARLLPQAAKAPVRSLIGVNDVASPLPSSSGNVHANLLGTYASVHWKQYVFGCAMQVEFMDRQKTYDVRIGLGYTF